MGGLSFPGKVPLDSCPEGGSFLKVCSLGSSPSLVASCISCKSPMPRQLQPKLTQRDLQCFRRQNKNECQKVHYFLCFKVENGLDKEIRPLLHLLDPMCTYLQTGQGRE